MSRGLKPPSGSVALGAWQPMLHEVKSRRRAAGVTNLYKNPARLGVDRWCALIGARAQTLPPVSW
jgi:pantothenate kinase type III